MASVTAGSDFEFANEKRFVAPDIGFCLTAQSSAVPIVRLPQTAQAVFDKTMNAHLNLEDRLSILRTEDQFRRWQSLDDERLCVLCERKFTGQEVLISTVGEELELHCPTPNCKSGVHQWVYPGNPLLSEATYEDWWRALGSSNGADPTDGAPSPGQI